MEPAANRSDDSLLPRNWGWLLLRGCLALLLGVLAILFPASALFAFTLVFAAYAAADGLFSLISGLRGATHHKERWGAMILRGLVGLLIAILFLLMPLVATVSYAIASLILLAVWAIAVGILEIAAAIRLRRVIRSEWLLALSGLLSILLGLAIPVLLVLYPAATILALPWVVGVYALVAGVVLIAQGIRLKSHTPPAAAGTGG